LTPPIGFVQDDQPGLGGGDAREFEQPFLAAAQSHREFVLKPRELEALQDGPDSGPFRLFLAPDPAGAGQG